MTNVVKSISIAYDPATYSMVVNGNVVRTARVSCRRVYFLPDNLVLKFGDDSQTYKEVSRLQKVRSADRKYFPQLIAHGRLDIGYLIDDYWILMERAYRSRRPANEKDRAKVRALGRRYRLNDVYGNDDEKWDGSNWFINKDTDLPVIVDLGC